MRPVFGMVDDDFCELNGKGEALEDSFGGKHIGDGGVKSRQIRRSAERVNGLEAGRERREQVGECHGTCSANESAVFVVRDLFNE